MSPGSAMGKHADEITSQIERRHVVDQILQVISVNGGTRGVEWRSARCELNLSPDVPAS
jgi:hypothetical protein